MDIHEDSSRQKYIKAGAVRVTLIPADKRKTEVKDWSGGTVIRIQAYADPAGPHSSKVYPGAEFSLDPKHGVIPLIEALCALVTSLE